MGAVRTLGRAGHDDGAVGCGPGDDAAATLRGFLDAVRQVAADEVARAGNASTIATPGWCAIR